MLHKEKMVVERTEGTVSRGQASVVPEYWPGPGRVSVSARLTVTFLFLNCESPWA
jgi:hypothetical protein